MYSVIKSLKHYIISIIYHDAWSTKY